MTTNVRELRESILKNLRMQGFNISKDNLISFSDNPSKEEIRNLHKHSYTQKLVSEREFILKSFKQLESYFSDGTSVNPIKFNPVLYLVEPNSELSSLFRFATLLWSIPVSQGFGRRLRFIVLDENNGKLVGLFALGDPVFNLSVRDNWIGWDHKKRAERLYNVMDLYVVGAVPPYSQLLAGKLMAMLATSHYVRKIVWKKYNKSIPTINKQSKKPHLILLTTSSALGRSSLYNRIVFCGRPLFTKIGQTSGWGHFHLSNGSFEQIREYLALIDHPINKSNRFGQGPNWKIRAIRTGLEKLGLPSNLLMHGIKREVYIAPLAENYKEILIGQSDKPKYYEYETESLIDFFKHRWFIPRANRLNDFKKIKASDTLRDLRKIAQL